jgi:acyl carrier protein
MPTQLTAAEVEAALAHEIATVIGRDQKELTPETALQTLGLDSLRFVSILVSIEKRFGVRLLEAGLTRESLRSIATLAAVVHASLRG